MRIFGRKANQQSTTPTAPDVPPELQPYYGHPSLGTRLRRIGMFVLPVIAALALIAALIAGGMWLKHRADDNGRKVATNQSTAQQPATNNSQSGSESQNQGQNSSQSQSTQQPTNNSSSSSSSTSNSASQQSSSTAQQSSASSQGAAPSNIPNTGPAASMYLLALVTASIATVAAYMWQLKTVRR